MIEQNTATINPAIEEDHKHLIPTLFQRPDRLSHPSRHRLHLIATIFNSHRYRNRWKLYEDFERMVDASGAVLYTCEIAYGQRDFAVTNPHNPRHLQLRTHSDLWLKENALNLMIERLPSDWEYMAWCDADVSFAKKDFANDTLHALQRHQVVQMFSHAYDLNSDNEIIQEHHGFVYSWLRGELPNDGGYYYAVPKKSKIHIGHPGYCWGWRRSAFDNVGRFIDFAMLGASDNHQAQALRGHAERSMHPDIHPKYREWVMMWQEKALRYIKKDVGYVPGALFHHWHGAKQNRFYKTRWEILVRNQFNPETDLKRDWQGLYQLEMGDSERMIHLRDDIRQYFALRREDDN